MQKMYCSNLGYSGNFDLQLLQTMLNNSLTVVKLIQSNSISISKILTITCQKSSRMYVYYLFWSKIKILKIIYTSGKHTNARNDTIHYLAIVSRANKVVETISDLFVHSNKPTHII